MTSVPPWELWTSWDSPSFSGGWGDGDVGYNHHEKRTPAKKGTDPYKNSDLICIVSAEQPLALRMK